MVTKRCKTHEVELPGLSVTASEKKELFRLLAQAQQLVVKTKKPREKDATGRTLPNWFRGRTLTENDSEALTRNNELFADTKVIRRAENDLSFREKKYPLQT